MEAAEAAAAAAAAAAGGEGGGGGAGEEAPDEDEDLLREEREKAALKRYYAGAAGAEDEFEACYTESWEWDGAGVIHIPEGGQGCCGDDTNPDLSIYVKRVALLSMPR